MTGDEEDATFLPLSISLLCALFSYRIQSMNLKDHDHQGQVSIPLLGKNRTEQKEMKLFLSQ